MNNFKYLVVGLVLSAFGQGAAARELVICSNNHYQFVMRDTAVVTYKVATLEFAGRQIQLKCQGEFQDQSASFSCQEDRAGDGRYLVGVILSETAKTAEVVHEQAYPLPPKTLAKLNCTIQN